MNYEEIGKIVSEEPEGGVAPTAGVNPEQIGDERTSGKEEETTPFVFSDDEKTTIETIALEASKIEDPEQRKAFLTEALKQVDKKLFTKYTQKRQKDVESIREYQRKLEEEAKRVLLDAYQSLLQQKEEPQKENEELNKIEEELLTKYGPELLTYFNKLLEDKISTIKVEVEQAKREREFIKAQQILAEKTKNTEFPYTPEVYALMEKWYETHPEYHKYISSIPSPLIALEFVYNQVKAEMLPKILEEKFRQTLKTPETSKQAESITKLKSSIASSEQTPPDEIDTLMSNIQKHIKGVY